MWPIKMKTITTIFILVSFASFGQTTITKEDIEKIPAIDSATFNLTDKDSFVYFVIPDTNYDKYRLPDRFDKPANWKKAEEAREQLEFYGNSYPDTFALQDALNTIDTAKAFWSVCSSKSWCLKNYDQVFPHLIARLTDKTLVGLTGTADLIIWDRIMSGDLKFYGHGGGMDEDIFTVAGRASWILNELTGEEFSVVHGATTEQELIAFKQQWTEFIEKLKGK